MMTTDAPLLLPEEGVKKGNSVKFIYNGTFNFNGNIYYNTVSNCILIF